MCLASCKRCSLLVCLLGARASAARRSAPGTRLSSSAFGVYSLRSSTLGSSSVGSSLAVPHRSAPYRSARIARLLGSSSLGSSSVSSSLLAFPHRSVPHRSALIARLLTARLLVARLVSLLSSSGFFPRLTLLLDHLLLPLGSSVLCTLNHLERDTDSKRYLTDCTACVHTIVVVVVAIMSPL